MQFWYKHVSQRDKSSPMAIKCNLRLHHSTRALATALKQEKKKKVSYLRWQKIIIISFSFWRKYILKEISKFLDRMIHRTIELAKFCKRSLMTITVIIWFYSPCLFRKNNLKDLNNLSLLPDRLIVVNESIYATNWWGIVFHFMEDGSVHLFFHCGLWLIAQQHMLSVF